MKVILLFGGRSVEHEISIRSARFVWANIPSSYEKQAVYIAKNGTWHVLGREEPSWKPAVMVREPVLDVNLGNPEAPAGLLGGDAVVIPILHGTYGEDGTVQGFLEMLGAAYVGAGVYSSAVAMNKDAAKRLVRPFGIKVLEYVALTRAQMTAEGLSRPARRQFALPVFVKPANLGSSVGITKVKRWEDLKEALDLALKYDHTVLIEQGLHKPKELEVAVLGEFHDPKEIIASLPGEIMPAHEFYSYEAKYLDPQGAELVVPANLPSKKSAQVRKIALEAFQILQIEGMCRVDLFMDRRTDEIYFNEVNTIPGFTSISMYPKLMHLAGYSTDRLIGRLIELARARWTRHRQKVFTYEPVSA